jgi:hypothetical protein
MMAIKSFAELDGSETVRADELKETLDDYARLGGSIDPRTVISIIRRTKLTADDRAALLSSARAGMEARKKSGDRNSAREYETVMEYIKHLG